MYRKYAYIYVKYPHITDSVSAGIMVDVPARRGQLNREIIFALSPFASESLLSFVREGWPSRPASARSFFTHRPNLVAFPWRVSLLLPLSTFNRNHLITSESIWLDHQQPGSGRCTGR